MGLKSVKNRLERVKTNQGMNISKELFEAIMSQKRYCDLSEVLRKEWLEYTEQSQEVFEDIHRMLIKYDWEEEGRDFTEEDINNAPITTVIHPKFLPYPEDVFRRRQAEFYPLLSSYIHGEITEEEYETRWKDIDSRFPVPVPKIFKGWSGNKED